MAIQQQLLYGEGFYGFVTSVQQVTVTIAANATSGTATLTTAVNTNFASEHIGGQGTTASTTAAANTMQPSFVLTNGTTVTATRNTADASNALTVVGTVISWNPAYIQSIQRGSIAMTTSQATNTATITSITTTNAAIQFNGTISDHTAWSMNVDNTYIQVTNATTITATRGSALTANITTYFVVVEFKSGILNSSTQQFSKAVAGGVGTATQTITSVTTTQAMLWNGGFTSDTGGGNTFSGDRAGLVLTNGTTVTVSKAGTNSVVTTASFTVVEFKSANIKSLNRGTIALTSAQTSNTATITAVNTNKCMANWLGPTVSTGTGASPATTQTNLVLTNSTTLTLNLNTAGIANTDSYEAIEWI